MVEILEAGMKTNLEKRMKKYEEKQDALIIATQALLETQTLMNETLVFFEERLTALENRGGIIIPN